MNKKRLIPITALALLAMMPNPTLAQDGAPIKNYVPPPMFGAPRPVPPKKVLPPTAKLPSLSLPAPKEDPVVKKIEPPKVVPKKEEPKIEEPKVVAPPKKPEPAPMPEQAPVPIPEPIKEKVIIPETGTIEKPLVKQGLEPIDLIKKEKSKENPAEKVEPPAPPPQPSQGVLTGPKTMPSVKKQNVETEVLFEPKNDKPVDLIDRAQKQSESEQQAEEEKKPEAAINISNLNPDFILPNFNVLADGSRKLNLVFQAQQSELQPEQQYTIEKLILPLMKENKVLRLRLESYASPQEAGLNADRRIALTRVMAVRELVIATGISANRLDVRSLGAQTDIQPMDRVEILLVP